MSRSASEVAFPPLGRALSAAPITGLFNEENRDTMGADNKEDAAIYKVVMNYEEQYSIWPIDYEMPLGWNDTGKSGTKVECLDYINNVWRDMRPLSLRKKMAQDTHKIKEMMYPLTEGRHVVRLGWSGVSSTTVRDAIGRGFIVIEFTETPELPGVGLFIDKDAIDTRQADFDASRGHLKVEGTGNIYAIGKVRCIVDLDLATWEGTGSLTIL